MPHYSDGTEAKIGDIVKGKPYNTPHEVIGPIVSITPGQESCNCEVAFVRAGYYDRGTFKVVTSFGGDHVFLGVDTDYGETRAFTKVA